MEKTLAERLIEIVPTIVILETTLKVVNSPVHKTKRKKIKLL